MSKTVLGGGIGGLSAAYYLRKKFPSHKIKLFEKSSRTGGWIKSTIQDEHLFEQGPRTLRPRGEKGANTLELVGELGLAKKVLPLSMNDAAVKNRMICVNNQLHSLPSGFLSLFKKHSPFSKPLVYHLLQEIYVPTKIVTEGDESIYSFVERRLGKEIAEYIISPLMCGICAGNAHDISVNFLMETMFKYEQQYGSITQGLLYNIFKRTPKQKSVSHLNKCAKKDRWSIYTFERGLETFSNRLEEVNKHSGVDIILNSNCFAIQVDKQVSLHIDNNTVITDHLVACIPANILSNLLDGHPKLSLLLKNIPFVTVGVVNLQYNRNVLQQEAFGFLVPPNQKLPILGVTFDSCCFPCGNGTVLTVMLGGYWFDRYFGHNPDKNHLLNVAMTQVRDTMGITEPPDAYLVNVHKDCIPQYVVGHNAILKEINNYITSCKLPLSLCGASYNGIGINDVIWTSKTAVESL